MFKMAHRKSVASSHNKSPENVQICDFCGTKEEDELKYGKFYEHRGIITHYFCVLFSSNMEQKGKDNEGILGFLADDILKELRRGKRLNCTFCKKSGATVGCTIARCPKRFHLPCGIKHGSLHQFFGEFKSFCINHRPYQKIDERCKKALNSSEKTLCYICYDEVNTSDQLETLWAPCCKKNAWFHRLCVQQLAMSAGYFFKCPLCNSKKEFQKAMLEYGIYIPCQDASWELVPHAYEELLYRHNRCDAKNCLCPKGRTHRSSNAKWELTLCRLCGSQGIHVACGYLKSNNPIWQCEECTSIISNTRPSSSNMSNIENEIDNSDSESDSSISVGGMSPKRDDIDILPHIQLKPGPRSFKILQAKMAKNVSAQLSRSESSNSNSSSSKNDSLPSGSKVVDKIAEVKTSINENDKKNGILVENCNKTQNKILCKQSTENNSEIINEKINSLCTSEIKLSTANSVLVQKKEVVIDLLSDDDDMIEIISETIVKSNLKSSKMDSAVDNKDNKDQEVNNIAVSANNETVHEENLPSTSAVIQPIPSTNITDSPLINQEEKDPGITIKISNVTTIPKDLHEKMQFSPNEQNLVTIADINQSALRRKRNPEEISGSEATEQCVKKRRVNNEKEEVFQNMKIACSIPLPVTYDTERDVQITRIESEKPKDQEEVEASQKQKASTQACILSEALINAGIVENPEANSTWQKKHTFLPIVKPGGSNSNSNSNLSSTNIHAIYMTKTSSTNKDAKVPGDCDGDAGTGPAADPGPGTSADTTSRESLGSRKLEQHRTYICNFTNCSTSPTPSSYSNSSYSTSTSTSKTSTISNRSGIDTHYVSINDIKFKLSGTNIVELTVKNKYKLELSLNQCKELELHFPRGSKSGWKVGSRRSSIIKAISNHPLDNFSEEVLHDDTKENRIPSLLTYNEISSLTLENRIPFSPQNSEVIGTSAKCLPNPNTIDENIMSTEEEQETPRCKVSIELDKIDDTLTKQLNLFNKDNSIDKQAETSEYDKGIDKHEYDVR